MIRTFVSSFRKQSKTVKGVAWSSAASWGRQLLTFAIFAILARLLTPEAFGLVALASIYVSLLSLFLSQGLGIAIIQREHVEEGHLDSAFWLSMALSVVSCLATMIFAGPVSSLFGEPALAPVLRWLSLVFILMGFEALPTAILTRELDFHDLAKRSLLSTIVGGVTGISLAFLGFGVWSLVVQQLMTALSGVVFLWWAVSWRPKFRLSIRHLRELLGFSLNIVGNNLFWFVAQRTDQTLVGYSFGTIALGPYALGAKITQLLMEATAGPLEIVALPRFSRLQADSKRLIDSFYRFSEAGAMIVFPAAAGLIVLADDIVPTLFGDQWAAAAPILQVFAIYAALRVALTFFHPLMLAKGRPGLYLFMFILNGLGTVVSCLIAVRFNPWAVSVALVLNLIVNSLLFFAVCGRIIAVEITKFLSVLGFPAFASVTMGLIVWAGHRAAIFSGLGPILRIVLCVSAGIAVYGTLIRLFRRQMLTEVFAGRESLPTEEYP